MANALVIAVPHGAGVREDAIDRFGQTTPTRNDKSRKPIKGDFRRLRGDMKADAEQSVREGDKSLSPKAFRDRRYRDAENIRPFAEHPLKNRIQVDGIDVAWVSTGWKRAFPETSSEVKIQLHTVSLFKNDEPIGFAEFEVFLFNDYIDTWEFISDADVVSQKMYDLAEGIKSVLECLNGGTFEFEPGMRIVEFDRLVMRPSYAGTSLWVAPLKEFIRRKFKCSRRAWNYALVLRPFPLEYENGARAIGMVDDESLMRRRSAMARLYKRTLGVELAVPEADAHWWMARLL